MTRDDWILAIFALSPLALFAIGLTLDMVLGGSVEAPCHTCGHHAAEHRGGQDQAAGRCNAVSEHGAPCGCQYYESPPQGEWTGYQGGCGG